MPTPLFYIMTDPTQAPFVTEGFRAYMTSGKEGLCVPCWKESSKALEYLKTHFDKDSTFVIVPSTVELLQKKMMEGVGKLFDIEFMD